MALDPEQLLSARRSSVRSRILLILMARGVLQAGHLADLAGVDRKRLKWALHGYPLRYRKALGLVPAALVEETRRGRSVEVRITREGRVLAKALVRERWQRERG